MLHEHQRTKHKNGISLRERCSGDGAEHENTKHKSKHIKDLEDTTAVEREMNTYAELTEEV